MLAPTVFLKRSLIVVHRWLGVALSIVFMLWFLSGIVMMYWTFPGISARDRLERAPTLDTARIALSTEEAYAVLEREEPPGQVRLSSFDGRPVYQFTAGRGGGRGGGGRGGRGGGTIVFADDGTRPGRVDAALIDRAASAWAGRPASDARKISVEEVDQWTVGGALRDLRPMYKYEFPDGQQVYVNGNTGEVVQYTTTASRFWAYLGAIPHWFYFTPLRRHQPQWFGSVVWSSLIGTGAALLGLVIAVWMYSPKKRYRYAGAPTSIPYRGWKRWHTITGLLFGVVTVTWLFSGWMSMGPHPIMNRLVELTVPSPPEGEGGGPRGGRGGGGGVNIAGALRGNVRFQMASYASKSPAEAIASVPDFEVKELEFTSFAGDPVYLARNGRGETRIIPVHGEPMATFDPEHVMRIVRETAGDNLAELRLMEQYDRYYLDRHRQRPLPVVYARLNDPLETRYYIDPKTATVAATYNRRGWVTRWLYNGLHSLNFPWLYNYRPLWDIVVIALMLGGTALCMTSIILTWRVIARKIAMVIPPRRPIPQEDLAPEAR